MHEYDPNLITEEQNSYQTGPTKPPKSRGGLIAVLLVLVIFLGGIASFLGIMNIRLFRQLSDQKNAPLHFSQAKEDETEQPSPNTDKGNNPSDVIFPIVDTPVSPENKPQEGGLSLQEIYEKSIASVVSIACQTSLGESTGTGVVISKDGYIITNCHVVDGAFTLSVILQDGQELDARLIGADTISDLAVLQVEAETLSPAEFGNSDSLRVGDTVVAIGDPLGIALRGTMTDGIVSAINRDITTSGRTMTLIQTNAALNSGNSGGPLLNCYGQVVGINTMKIGDFMSDAGVEGLGFAIPSTTVKDVVEQLIAQGYVDGRPALGFAAETVSPFQQMYYGLPQGVYITEVDSTSHAAQIGLAPGDILLSFGGARITDTDTLIYQLYARNAGDSVNIVVYRDGQQYTATLTLEQAK